MVDLVLDLDTGIDDAIALSIAAKDKGINLLGVTCTYGNVTVEESAYNTLALLSLLGREDVPVYIGRNRSLLSSSPYTPHEAGRKSMENMVAEILNSRRAHENPSPFLQKLSSLPL